MLDSEIQLTLKLHQKLFADVRRVALLKEITKTGSLSQAAKKVDISYKTAWDAINQINQLAPQPFVITSVGGKSGGGAKLSGYAVRFIQLYDLLTEMQYRAFNALNDENVPLDDLLQATAKLSLQTSARNQVYATIKSLDLTDVVTVINVLLSDQQTYIDVQITQRSAERLQLIVDKAVILLIKAPAIELSVEKPTLAQNVLAAKITKIVTDKSGSDIELTLNSGLSFSATLPELFAEPQRYQIGQLVYMHIEPENIIIAALI